MGRAFEFRKARKFKRWDKMSKAFTRLGKEIAIAVKEGGPNPESNARLRTAIQNAKGVNMPKDKVESAIKRASSKEEKDYEEIVYEGYGPYGIAILVETATDNINRTVANMRVYFSRGGGALGKTGSLDFLFTRKGIFKIAPEGTDIEELELELIDFGAEDIYEHEGEIIIETAFTDFGTMQKALEEKGLNVISAELQRIPNTRTELTDEQAEEIENLIERFEEDDDVQAVYHNMQ
ncbi:YebC/PmpR family DNA-binding transcriptional regulator [Pontibacter sp. SGAir0037]|uniref:YebC/PmpR family DNA-binding transcriptional regulator n=1 Tax=Pontibacter sp. SGAir0037 TaxID=2571030 RepID=UPI0010CD0679|nr:YebC/PmpR family DNA-binding transcriptional regulator [Pontibacter sp. SGAir0037]QCR20958.1 YebC/PmpR family DNA-binding transcriptional regulator [Pontibacter sp. SGAir0037]